MVGLWTIRLLVQVHSHLVQFYAHAQRIWQSPFLSINPQTGNKAGVWMTSCPEEMVLRIWGFSKDVSWVFDRWGWSSVFYRWGMQLSFLNLDQQRWTEIVNIARYVVCWGWVSIVWLALAFKNCVSLSLRVAMDRSQMLINPFVSERTESACIVFVYVSVLLLLPTPNYTALDFKHNHVYIRIAVKLSKNYEFHM